MAVADFALDMLGEIESVKQMWAMTGTQAHPLIQSVAMRIGVDAWELSCNDCTGCRNVQNYEN
jgi:hypothetical protein